MNNTICSLKDKEENLIENKTKEEEDYLSEREKICVPRFTPVYGRLTEKKRPYRRCDMPYSPLIIEKFPDWETHPHHLYQGSSWLVEGILPLLSRMFVTGWGYFSTLRVKLSCIRDSHHHCWGMCSGIIVHLGYSPPMYYWWMYCYLFNQSLWLRDTICDIYSILATMKSTCCHVCAQLFCIIRDTNHFTIEEFILRQGYCTGQYNGCRTKEHSYCSIYQTWDPSAKNLNSDILYLRYVGSFLWFSEYHALFLYGIYSLFFVNC